MDKWLSGESTFKRTAPAPTENGAAEETKELYESSSIEELRNRLAAQLEKKEHRRSTLRNSFFFMAILTTASAIATVLLLLRVGVLQGRNNNLNQELEGLRSTIQTLEGENRDVKSKLEMAEKERRDLKSRLDALDRQKNSLEEELRKSQTLIGNTSEEKTYLEEILINKTKEIEQLKKNSQPAAGAAAAVVVTGDAQQLSQALREKDAQIQRLSEQNQTLSNRIQKLYKITNDKIAAINVAKITLEETIAEARKNIESEWSTVDLGSIQAGQTLAPAPARAFNPNAAANKKEGHILAINEEHGFVVVDLGRANGVDSSSTFTVRKNGQDLATLTALEIRDVMTACNIKELKPGGKLALNDPVLIQK